MLYCIRYLIIEQIHEINKIETGLNPYFPMSRNTLINNQIKDDLPPA
jgi:hypothetical protein